jgi:hypothetical protein
LETVKVSFVSRHAWFLKKETDNGGKVIVSE